MRDHIKKTNELSDRMGENQKKFLTFRRKLLALNATMEAAKAGKAGAEFAIAAHDMEVLASEQISDLQEP